MTIRRFDIDTTELRMRSDIDHEDDVSRHRRDHDRQNANNERRNRRRRFGRHVLVAAIGIPSVIFGGGYILDRGLDQMERDGRPPTEVVQHLSSIAPPEGLSETPAETLER